MPAAPISIFWVTTDEHPSIAIKPQSRAATANRWFNPGFSIPHKSLSDNQYRRLNIHAVSRRRLRTRYTALSASWHTWRARRRLDSAKGLTIRSSRRHPTYVSRTSRPVSRRRRLPRLPAPGKSGKGAAARDSRGSRIIRHCTGKKAPRRVGPLFGSRWKFRL